jgi:hypothetical protein
MANAMPKDLTIASVIAISYRELQHLFAVSALILLGSAKITSPRSPIIPALTNAGAFFSGPSLLASVFKRRLRSQNLRVCPSAVVIV